MTDDPLDIRDDETRLLERRLIRVQGLLRIYRYSLITALLVIGMLLVLLFFAKAPALGRAIIIDGKAAAMVRSEQAAAAVRKRLLAPAGGADAGATFRERWEDETRKVEGEKVLSVGEAVRLLKGKVTVVKEAYAIEESGHELVVVPTREMAQTVLDRLKARYASPGDAVVRMTRLRPAPTIRPTTELPDRIVTDEQAAVNRLLNARTKVTYRVRAGDYPERIASAHDLTIDEFWSLNPSLRGQTLHPGQTVTVLAKGGGLTVITIKETVTTQTIKPPVQKQTTVTLPRGQKKITDPGRPGRKRVRWEVTMHNDREVARRPLTEEIIVVAQPQVVLVGVR